MSTPKFDITIDKNGQVKIKVHGVSGKECLQITDMLKEIIGREESRQLTSEYYGSPGHVRTSASTQNDVHTRG
ncbi:MAG: DUF2997 domain-containing protein [Phycisphaerales bacterium]|nr:DUF2997 domain-containing protein [Phycisphaerales bacterium]